MTSFLTRETHYSHMGCQKGQTQKAGSRGALLRSRGTWTPHTWLAGVKMSQPVPKAAHCLRQGSTGARLPPNAALRCLLSGGDNLRSHKNLHTEVFSSSTCNNPEWKTSTRAPETVSQPQTQLGDLGNEGTVSAAPRETPTCCAMREKPDSQSDTGPGGIVPPRPPPSTGVC